MTTLHDAIPVIHAPYSGQSLGSRADCCCGMTGDWTTHDEAEFDAARHLADHDALPAGRRVLQGFGQYRPCGTDAARRRHARNGEKCGDCA